MPEQVTMKVTVMPAGHGDCFLVQCDEFNILVDSGPRENRIHDKVRDALLKALGGRSINLAIVTHYDDDHIGGLERIQESGDVRIEKLLFNSPKHIADHIDLREGKEVPASWRQAINVAGAFEPCNRKVIIAGGKDYEFFDRRIKLKMLSPKDEDIIKFGKRLQEDGNFETPAGLRGRKTPICKDMAQLLAIPDDGEAADNSKVNALSLAFILSFAGRSILFLGDSWPSRVTPALEALATDGKSILFDLVFVSHHGSKNNSTEEMYRYIDTTRYVISTDGKQNPDLETFRRILRATEPKQPNFYFSEDTPVLREMFPPSDIPVFFPKHGARYFDL